MRDEQGDGLGGVTLPIADDQELDTPNCPDCLVRMQATDSPRGEPYWACTECGFVALAR